MARCADTITRKSMLYKTGVEYGDYTMNHVQGCSHGCMYPCYAFLMAKRFGRVSSYEEWCQPLLVSNTLELLDKEIPRLRKKIKSVQLCFTTDPFMYGYDDICSMSIKAIDRLNAAGVPCVVLSKGVLPSELSERSQENRYGITLISLDEEFRRKVEPGAAPYADRIAALKQLHDAGCKTWASVEPYPTPNLVQQDVIAALSEISFVDKIVFGRTNYNKLVSAYPHVKDWYNEQVERVTSFCDEHEIECYIKSGTWTGTQQMAA